MAEQGKGGQVRQTLQLLSLQEQPLGMGFLLDDHISLVVSGGTGFQGCGQSCGPGNGMQRGRAEYVAAGFAKSGKQVGNFCSSLTWWSLMASDF